MKRNTILRSLLLASTLTSAFAFNASGMEPIKESEQARAERMAWFEDAQYGMFIHFGLYSQLGGEWKGVQADWYAEWIQATQDIEREEYAKLLSGFNPAEFDADRIVRAAKEAKMEYLVITSKHHEGFCLWDSDYTEFDVASTPFKGRDYDGIEGSL